MFSQKEQAEGNAKIKVIGVGGAGGNAINNMITSDLKGVEFIVANTDVQALEISGAGKKLQIGDKLTEGLGAGANPEVGRAAAEESAEMIRNTLKDSHMVFITAGFGGGTGTGAAPVIAEICKELGILTVAVLTKPFLFEGRKRAKQADDGLAQIRQTADTVITIPNDRLRGLASKNATMLDMFKKADEILLHSVKGITDLILVPGLVNLDFADVKTTMEKAGLAIMGMGSSNGENRAIEAAERAISHPLLEDLSINGAKAVLINLTSTSAITMDEMSEACTRIYEEVGDEADIMWGSVIDESLGDELRITVIATGIGTDDDPPMRQAPVIGRPRPKTGPAPSSRRPAPRQEPVAPAPEPAASDNTEYLDHKAFDRIKQVMKEGGYQDGKEDEEDLDIPTFLRKRRR